MPKFANRVRFTTATTGTGTITVGSAVSKYRTPASAPNLADGDVVRLWIEDGTAWEESLATLGSSKTTLTRTLVESSTGSLLNLSGSAEAFIGASERDIIGGRRGQMLAVATNQVLFR
jgi:hypothetical protein